MNFKNFSLAQRFSVALAIALGALITILGIVFMILVNVSGNYFYEYFNNMLYDRTTLLWIYGSVYFATSWAIGVVSFVLGLIIIVIGVAISFKKNWSHSILVMVAAVINAIFGLFYFVVFIVFASVRNFDYFTLDCWIFIPYALVLWLITFVMIKSYFRGLATSEVKPLSAMKHKFGCFFARLKLKKPNAQKNVVAIACASQLPVNGSEEKSDAFDAVDKIPDPEIDSADAGSNQDGVGRDSIRYEEPVSLNYSVFTKENLGADASEFNHEDTKNIENDFNATMIVDDKKEQEDIVAKNIQDAKDTTVNPVVSKDDEKAKKADAKKAKLAEKAKKLAEKKAEKAKKAEAKKAKKLIDAQAKQAKKNNSAKIANEKKTENPVNSIDSEELNQAETPADGYFTDASDDLAVFDSSDSNSYVNNENSFKEGGDLVDQEKLNADLINKHFDDLNLSKTTVINVSSLEDSAKNKKSADAEDNHIADELSDVKNDDANKDSNAVSSNGLSKNGMNIVASADQEFERSEKKKRRNRKDKQAVLQPLDERSFFSAINDDNDHVEENSDSDFLNIDLDTKTGADEKDQFIELSTLTEIIDINDHMLDDDFDEQALLNQQLAKPTITPLIIEQNNSSVETASNADNIVIANKDGDFQNMTFNNALAGKSTAEITKIKKQWSNVAHKLNTLRFETLHQIAEKKNIVLQKNIRKDELIELLKKIVAIEVDTSDGVVVKNIEDNAKCLLLFTATELRHIARTKKISIPSQFKKVDIVNMLKVEVKAKILFLF